jgi:3-deoxy-manno-octulosonate cytidylyltransferase (CMP-KDO synthetase)
MTESAKPRVAGIIPARLGSTRLTRKVLRPIAGRPLLAWVHEAAARCAALDELVVAADSEEVAELCAASGFRCILTDPALPSGTDRLYAIAPQVPADIYVNIQADEPLLRPEHIEALLRPFAHTHVDVSTLKVPCSPENIANPNAVKVVTANDGRALYFSRATIPFDRDGSTQATYWKHLGLYAYRSAALTRFASLAPSPLERTERLEQLRMLENGMVVYVEETPFDSVGVDTEEDLQRVEALLQRSWPTPDCSF